MSWSHRRQLMIFLVVTGFFAITAFILWVIYHPRPSCTDGVQNQNELAIDCGGECLAVCQMEVSAPVVWWQRAFWLKNQTYDLAALIENKTDKFGLSRLDYVFRVYGANQILLKTIPGQTFVNPNEQTLIYVPQVALAEIDPTAVTIDFTAMVWTRIITPVEMKLSRSEARFTNTPSPEVRAFIKNDSLENYRDIEVDITLADTDRNVFAVSRTFIDLLESGQSKEVFFSWPEPFNVATDIVPVIDLYPRFNTLKPSNI